ncbi:hypothetical protein [Pseudomonas sp. UBA1879]|uniref:hypothetical protein n=1 Tax=Pseudomonas sp. UBA1879 TaxID=1947305 RepID=UPI0025EBC75E|nr:hypothetical protein [Pseudomonas sp. UBA1879]
MDWASVSFWIEHNPGLASWVQAVGSIVAIFSAIFIASSQNRHQRKLARQIAEEKSLAQAGRLYLIAKEYSDSLELAVKPFYEEDAGDADQSIAVTFQRILDRLNNNFDDDYNPARNVQIHILRAALTALLFTLDNSKFMTHQERAIEIQRLKELSPALLASCLKLLESAKN